MVVVGANLVSWDRILHFTTFVIACVECSKRNSASSVVYVNTTHYAPYPDHGYNGQAMGYAPAVPTPVYQHDGVKV